MNDLKYWIWLSRIEGIGSVKKQNLLEKFKNPIRNLEGKKRRIITSTDIK